MEKAKIEKPHEFLRANGFDVPKHNEPMVKMQMHSLTLKEAAQGLSIHDTIHGGNRRGEGGLTEALRCMQVVKEYSPTEIKTCMKLMLASESGIIPSARALLDIAAARKHSQDKNSIIQWVRQKYSSLEKATKI